MNKKILIAVFVFASLIGGMSNRTVYAKSDILAHEIYANPMLGRGLGTLLAEAVRQRWKIDETLV